MVIKTLFPITLSKASREWRAHDSDFILKNLKNGGKFVKMVSEMHLDHEK